MCVLGGSVERETRRGARVPNHVAAAAAAAVPRSQGGGDGGIAAAWLSQCVFFSFSLWEERDPQGAEGFGGEKKGSGAAL